MFTPNLSLALDWVMYLPPGLSSDAHPSQRVQPPYAGLLPRTLGMFAVMFLFFPCGAWNFFCPSSVSDWAKERYHPTPGYQIIQRGIFVVSLCCNFQANTRKF